MLYRIIRNLTALFSVYGFSTNPLRYLVTLLIMALCPYLLYLVFGTIGIILILGVVVAVLVVQLRKKSRSRAY